MADVQLEHGHVRIANRLAEALLDAEFSGVQFKLLHTLIRLTYGWRRRTVTLSQSELAEYMHTTASGTFRAALRELIAEGVVIQADCDGKGKRSTYAVEKDFAKWGRFEVGAGRLARIYGERPASNDEAVFQAGLFGGNAPETGTDPSPKQAVLPPNSGIGTPHKSLSGETYASGKTVERQGKTENQKKEAPDAAILVLWEADMDLAAFGEYGVNVMALIRSARSPLAMAQTIACHLPHRGGTSSYEAVGLAVRQFEANESIERFNALHFEGYVKRAAGVLDRRIGRRALRNETAHIDADALEREKIARETAERTRLLAAFQQEHPTRYAELKAKATASFPGTGTWRAVAIEGALASLVRQEARTATVGVA